MKEPYEKINAIVVGFDQWQPDSSRIFSLLGEEIVLAKAGSLYADEVNLASQVTSMAFGLLDAAVKFEPEAAEERLEELISPLSDDEEAAVLALLQGLQHDSLHVAHPFVSGVVLARWMYGDLPAGHLPLTAERSLKATEPAVFSSGYVEFARSPVGLERIERTEALSEEVESETTRELLKASAGEMKRIRAGGDAQLDFGSSRTAQSSEAALLSSALGGLRAFPEADWDVIFDVRERLEPSRVNFRVAISKAANELKNCDDDDEVADACIALRRQVIAPALTEIDSALDDLGVIPTLLRVSKETPTVGALTTNLALVAGDPAGLGLSALAHGLASAPMIASGVRELAHQREQRRHLAAHPFWLLHQIRASQANG